MNFIFKKKRRYLFIYLIALILLISSPIYSLSFNKDTYLEMSPVIKGNVCIMDGNKCLTSTEKEIIFGFATIYPDVDKKYDYVITETALIFFEGKMFFAGQIGIDATRIDISVPNWTLSPEIPFNAVMNTINPDETKIKETMKTNFTINLKENELSSLTLILDNQIYALSSVEKTIKMEGFALSDNFISSDNLLKMKLYVTPENRQLNPEVNNKFGVEFEYGVIGSKNANIVIDYGEGTNEIISPSWRQLKVHKYENEGDYSAFIKVIYPSGEIIISNNVEIKIDNSISIPTKGGVPITELPELEEFVPQSPDTSIPSSEAI